MKTYDTFGQLPKEQFDEVYLNLIEADIAGAQAHLDDLPEDDRRGLSLETLRHFRCGFLPNWILTKSRAEYSCGIYRKDNGEVKKLPPPSPRIIIPTASGHHFNAVATKSARRNMQSEFWKQHAGAKELFADPDAFKADILFVVEGEIDAMSIWQASAGKISALAILGCGNWKKTLLPRLHDLQGKKLILLLDADAAGNKAAKKLFDELLHRGCLAVNRKLFDSLTKADQNYFGYKVDANNILKDRGNEFLHNLLLQKIITDAQQEFDELKERLNKPNPFAEGAEPVLPTPQENSRLVPAQTNSAVVVAAQDTPQTNDYTNRDDILRILSYVPAKELSRDEWFSVGCVLKRYGFDLDTFRIWSDDGDIRYSAETCRTQWDSIKNAKELDGKGNKVGTLIELAKKFGYQPPAKSHIEQTQPAADEDPKIIQWQEDNGTIDPKLLAKLKAQAERIKAETDLAAAARDTTTIKFLGAFTYYSFFADVTENFLQRFITKRNDAKANIAAHKRADNGANFFLKNNKKPIGDVYTATEPTQQDYSLTTISPAELKNEISKYKTAAAREHKKYLAQKIIDDQNYQIEAERDAYENIQPTTQSKIVDCPVNLVLPFGVYFDDNGIKIVDYEKPVGKYGRPVIEACQNPVVPVSVYRETEKNFTQYEIAIKTDNFWRYATFDGRTLEDPRAISELSNYGVHISNARALAQYFAKIIALNERNGKIKRIKVYKQPGWQENDKDCTEFIWPVDGEDYVVQNGNFDYKGIFTPRGDPDQWGKMFKRVLYHDPKHYEAKTVEVEDVNGNKNTYTPDTNPNNISAKPNLVAAVTLGFAMGAPLVKPLKIRNPQMIFGFESGNGKTAAAKFAVSFFGRPDRGLAPTLNATQNFLEDLSAKINDFPHVVDELQSAKKRQRENMDEWLYNFSSGVTRGRADIKGHALPTYNYHGCRMFTGEQTITNDNSGQGAISRIFEIKKSELFADPFAIEIHNFVAENYGHFGKLFATEFVPKNRLRIKEYFDRLRNTFSYGSCDMLSSHATALAFSLTGLRFALEALGYKNADEIVIDLVEASQELIDETPTKKEASNVARALPELMDFVDTHPKNFIVENVNSQSEITSFTYAEGNEIYGVKMNDGHIAFFPFALKKILSKELDFPSAQALIRAFGKASYLEGSNSRIRPFQTRLSSYFYHWFGKDRRFYVFKPHEQLEQLSAA